MKESAHFMGSCSKDAAMNLSPRLHDQNGQLLEYARAIMMMEANAIGQVAERLGTAFEEAVMTIHRCTQRVAVTGVGKSADIGLKIVGTLNSMGTRAYQLDATKAMHGDLGMVHPDDIVIALSHSGESEELIRLIPALKQNSGYLCAITGTGNSTLARAADAAIVYGPIDESCPHQLAPSSSTTVMLVLGDALAFSVAELRKFTSEDFARYHPAGSLGRKLSRVEQSMRQGDELRIASSHETIRQVFAQVGHEGRRTGAIMLVDESNRLVGLFTDSDLARLFEHHLEGMLDHPISEVMTKSPITISRHARLSDAIDLFRQKKISEIPVIDDAGCPIGMVDITDMIGLIEVDRQSPLREPMLRRFSA